MNMKYQIQFHQVNIRVPVFDLAGNWSGSNLRDCDPALVTKCIKKEKNNADDDDDNEILQKLQRDDVRLNDLLSFDKFHGVLKVYQ